MVYLKEQAEPVRKRVALEVFKLSMDFRLVTARFSALTPLHAVGCILLGYH